jgi:SAM-dependent methyltransferase
MSKAKHHAAVEKVEPSLPEGPLKIDLGCGSRKPEGCSGVDQYAFKGVDVVCDFGKEPWPFKDDSVSEAQAVHSFEHLTANARMHFMNELYRVLAPGGQARITCPVWTSSSAYGDMTHQWPPVSAFFINYLVRSWRLSQAPHTDKYFNPEGMDCDFDIVGGYNGPHMDFQAKHQEVQQFATNHYIDAVSEIFMQLTKPLTPRDNPKPT